MIGDLVGKSDRTEENRVMAANLFFPVLRQHITMFGVVVITREIEMIEMQIDAEFRRDRFQHTKPFRHDLLANPVTGDDRDVEPVLCQDAPLGRLQPRDVKPEAARTAWDVIYAYR